jgi:predicted ATP-grasp superfamily ATP-dependent carboligase
VTPIVKELETIEAASQEHVTAPARQTGALVIGGEHPGLGIARSLGQRGIPVYVVDDQLSVSSFSRYTKRFVRVKDLRDERKTVETVLDVGRRFRLRNWVLFPTRDETVVAFSRYRAELSEFFRVPTPAWDTVKWAWNKKNTYDLAEKLNIPCPKTFSPQSEDEIEVLRSKLPLAIKPAVKENFFYATGAKAWRAQTIDELRQIYRQAMRYISPQEILVQQIIPGDGSHQVSYCAFFRNGQAHSSLVARRARQHPREFGRAATYVESIELPLIEGLSQRFLKAIDYYGLVEVEFKHDLRDGEYKLLDVNARSWGFHVLGSAAGVDFSYMLYADQVGEPVLPPCRARPGVGWLRLLTDVPTAISDILGRHITVSDYLASLRKTRVESVFCRKDPLPSVAEIALLPYLIAKKL